jgi:phosphoglucosamine mutase
MRKLFGTDGIRGRAGDDLTADLVADVGRALATFIREQDGVDRPRIVIGRDTRVSGPELEAAFVDGFCSSGGDAMTTEVMPTAGIAYLTSSLGTDAGVVISASHNPPEDNGIKLFGRGGWKLPIASEAAIETLVRDGVGTTSRGRVEALDDGAEMYIEHLARAVPAKLGSLDVVIDCGNGAASAIAPAVLDRLGAKTEFLHCEGNGAAINDGGGALHPDVAAAHARARSCAGLSFDGDADRVLMSDEEGRLVDGDAIIALLAKSFDVQAIAVTVMANQALREWCAAEGIEVVETPVGDRHVLEAMRERGLVLGGEQSGHILCLGESTTGDGILTGVHVLDLIARSGKRLADLVPFRPFPQVMVNVKTNGARGGLDAAGVRDAIEQAERKLGEHGRVLVRPSGTEPLVRVMVEAQDEALATELAEIVAAAVSQELG